MEIKNRCIVQKKNNQKREIHAYEGIFNKSMKMYTVKMLYTDFNFLHQKSSYLLRILQNVYIKERDSTGLRPK